MRRDIEVFADWAGLGGPILMGVLHAEALRRKEVFSFDYAPAWLEGPHARALDPSLRLLAGPQYPGTKGNFGVFLDSAPDRWGRVLLQRKEALRARQEDRRPRKLLESDYLLGVHDAQRPGALRFRLDGSFRDDDPHLSAPPWTALRDLEAASLSLERDDAESRPDYERWLEMLLAPGSSLGGARPKASVVDPEGQLWMAKFPSAGDRFDVGAWQGLLHRLGARAGLEVADGRVERFGAKARTFLTRRFDRTVNGERIHFCSALTLLDRRDGDDAETGASYLELAKLVAQGGAEPQRDSRELWSRIAFSVLVSNTDDHLRNHGFLLTDRGWRLAPAYDLNPNPDGMSLALNIDETDNRLDADLVLSVARHFQLAPKDAKARLAEIRSVVATWESEAKALRIPRSEIERMAPAFEAGV